MFYGELKKGDPAWMEDVILETTDKTKIPEAKIQAAKNDYVNLRIMQFNEKQLTMPDFTKTL
jgi:hypothetical protein